MASLKEYALTKLGTVNLVDMKTAGSVALFTVPVGKSFICTQVTVRNNSASLAGGTSYGFTGWRSGIDLSGMTVTNGYRELISIDNVTFTVVPGGSVFYLIVTTGATLACTATLDILGYLV